MAAQEREAEYPPSKRARHEPENGERPDRADDGGREKASSEAVDRVVVAIERLGEQGKGSLQDNIERVAEHIMREIGDHAPVIVASLVDCAATKPDRTSVYSTLVGLINAATYDTGKEVVLQLSSRLQACLEECDFTLARSLVRFIADLGNASVLMPGSVVALLETLVAVSEEVGVPQSRVDEYIGMALEVLPWVGRDLCERAAEPFNRLMSNIEDYIGRRSTDHIRHHAVFTIDTPEQADALEVTWAQVSGLQKREWKETAITRPYIFFDDVLVTSSQHDLPSVSIPPHSLKSTYPHPKVAFRIFGPGDTPEDCTLPPSRSVERLIYEAKLRETFYSFSSNVGLCASEIAEAIYSMRRVPLNYLAVEVLLGDMLALPQSRAPTAFYHAVLAELVRTTAPFADALTLGMDHVFHRLDMMDVECAAAFAQWVGHFLNYYGFKFRWELWFDVVAVAPDMPQSVFVREALIAMTELSYIERVQKELPEQLAPFLPEAPEPQFKYGSADSATRKVLLIEEISKAVRNKMMTLALVAPVVDSITEIRRVTDIGSAVPAIVEEEEESEERLAEQRLEVYFSCVLNVGSKTMSHLRIILQRQLEALEYYVKTPESRGLVLRVASAYWVKSPLMQQCAIGHLLRNRVIEPSTVVDWVFAPEQVELFCRRFVWNILFDTLDLCGRRAAAADADAGAASVCQDSLLMVLQHFSAVLNERLVQPGEDQAEHRGWALAATGRYLQLCRRYCRAPYFRDAMPTVADAILPDLHPVAAAMLRGVTAVE